LALHAKMQTQNEGYWQSGFAVTDDDLEALYAAILEDGRPRSQPEIITLIMQRRYTEELEALTRRFSQGEIYRPSGTYDVDQQLIFSAFDYKLGTVVGTRVGSNPRYGEFTVLRVKMETGRKMREFAADLHVPHRLNEVKELGEEEEELPPERLHDLYGHWVQPHLEAALEDGDEFVCFAGRWFLRELLPEVHIGHLNIAEALIDEARTPRTTGEILKELDFPPGTTAEANKFALDRALSGDDRFDDVSTSGEPLWYLLSLEPAAIAQMPPRLEPAYEARQGMLLHRESLDLAEEISDEWDQAEGALMGGVKPVDSSTFILTYPHRREGTMPINWKTATLFPLSQNPRIRVTLVDRRNREKLSLWAAPDKRYATGLGEWYRKHKVPVGALIELHRTEDPFTIEISYLTQRRKGEWVRSLRAQNGALAFEIQKRAYVCRYDRQILLDDGQDEAIDQLWGEIAEKAPSLIEVLRGIFPELAKLNAEGMVHAKALYSAVNVVRRCGVVPILAELARQACFDPVGDGNWVFDPALEGQTYDAPEEVMGRPHSQREDVSKYQVFRYSGF
jgi:hypothetical protein